MPYLMQKNINPNFVSLSEIPPLVEDDRTYPTKELLELADGLELGLLTKSFDNLTPIQFKYAIETKINRDQQAGKNLGKDLTSHVTLFGYNLDQNGFVDTELYEEINEHINDQIEVVENLGGECYVVDIEVTQNQSFLVDVISSIGYVNTDLAFGFREFDSGNHLIFQNGFVNDVNDQIIFEAIDESEYFLTDISPNPSVAPFGITLGSTQILGNLGLGDCLEYAGTLEAFGGQELVYGGFYDDEQMGYAEVNERILRGINHIIQNIPTDQGYQMINLDFKSHTNLFVSGPLYALFTRRCVQRLLPLFHI